MSKQVRRSTHGTGKSRQTVQSYQPGWMAHWMRASSIATAERLDDAACATRATTLDSLTSVKDPGKSEANTESLRLSSAGFRDEGMCSAQMEHGQGSGAAQATRPSIDHSTDCAQAMNFKGGIQAVEGTSMNPLELVRTSSQERCVGSSTHIAPYHDLERYKFDKGKAVVSPPIRRPSIFFNNQLPDTKLNRIGQEHGQKHLHLGSEIGAPSMNDQDHPRFGKDFLQKMQKCSRVISLLPTESSEKNEQKVPCCVHETMRICTTVEAPPRGRPWFSQTTHSLLITKNTDANVLKEADIFRSLVTRMSGNSSSVLDCGPPFFGQANRGVTLQPISSSNSEGQQNAGDTGIGASKNESSAETDTMNMDFSEERANCGANSARSTKVFNFNNNPSPRIDAASSREVGCRWPPEINLELPALPAAATSSEDIPTSSRTQSLEMDMLQAEPKSNLSPDDSPKADPTTRWVKRLKLSSSETFAQGSKISKLAKKLSHDKGRDFFRSILKKGITREQPSNSKDEQPKKSKELLRSHVWIKRWLRNGSQISHRKPETVVVCEPQSLKSSLDELPKKQFPSIAAMALMGRAMTGFQSCELQKRGSFTIWNTSTL